MKVSRADNATVIRTMRAADVPSVVDVHVRAFPGFFLSFLGPRFLALFYSEAIALNEIALVAEAESGVVGLAMGSVRPGRFFRLLLRRRALRFAWHALPAVARRPRVALRIARALLKPRDASRADGVATLMSLAVDPRSQGGGTGRSLVQAFNAAAQEGGATRVSLTTDRDHNERTNAFYRALGFEVVREILTPEGRVLNELEIVTRNG